MGYHTDFDGVFTFSRPLTVNELNKLNKFLELRHVTLDMSDVPDSEKENTLFGEFGENGIFYFGEKALTTDVNRPPKLNNVLHMDLYIPWEVGADGDFLSGLYGKAYKPVDSLRFLIDYFFSKIGVTLNGKVTWEGEESGDVGLINVINNKINVHNGVIVYDNEKTENEKLIEWLKNNHQDIYNEGMEFIK